MLRLMLAVLCASALTACAPSMRSMPPSPIRVRPAPAAALEPCQISPVPRQADDSASSADAESAIRNRGFDVAACEAKRQLLVSAWPTTL
jgi:hypothetical protein